MPRSLIERTFPDRFEIPIIAKGVDVSRKVAERNALPVGRISEVPARDLHFYL